MSDLVNMKADGEMVKVGMINDLEKFIETEKTKDKRTLSDWLKQWIIEKIIDGECKVTGSATDHDKKKMYVEFTFYDGGEEWLT